MHDAIVVGGGIAGLTAAWELQEAGKDVILLERDDTPGGNIRTLQVDGYRCERGPHSFMGSSEYVWRLVSELGAEEQIEEAAPAAANRFILREGRLHALPMSFGSFVGTGLLSFCAKLRLAMEPFIGGGAKDEDTAWDFFQRRFGKEAATYIMSPFVSGVYAGDVTNLGAKAAFPKFWQFEKDSGSMIMGARKYMKAKKKRLKDAGLEYKKGLFCYRGGFGGLTGEVARKLGDRVKLGHAAVSLRQVAGAWEVTAAGQTYAARAVVIAVPPNHAAELLQEQLPAAVPSLRTIPMAPVTLIHWRCTNPPEDIPAGFGFLVPRITGVRLLGTLFPSQLFAGRAPDGHHLFASFYGGATDGEAMELNDNQLLELLLQEHREIFGLELKDVEVLTTLRYSAAIPQLLPEHPQTVAELTEVVDGQPGLFLAGNYLTGVGVEAAVESGYAAGDRVRVFLEGASAS
jgi:protoporphyrinogen/coproporphyrinogen III oxidase